MGFLICAVSCALFVNVGVRVRVRDRVRVCLVQVCSTARVMVRVRGLLKHVHFTACAERRGTDQGNIFLEFVCVYICV